MKMISEGSCDTEN